METIVLILGILGTIGALYPIGVDIFKRVRKRKRRKQIEMEKRDERLEQKELSKK